MKCECGKELTEEELKAEYNVKFPAQRPLCYKCMSDYADEVITGI